MSGHPFFSRFTLPHGLAVLATVALVSACTPAEQPAPDGEPVSGEAKPDAKPEAEAKPEEKPEAKPEAEAEAKPEGDLEAVAACASYTKLYRACAMEKAPTPERKQLLFALENQTRSWKQALADSSKSEIVAGECKAAMKAAQVATQEFDCTWK